MILMKRLAFSVGDYFYGTMIIPDPIKRLIEEFASLPSIGPRQATRLAFHLLNSGRAKIESLKNAVAALNAVTYCKQCFFYFSPKKADSENALSKTPMSADNGLCEICRRKDRGPKTICLVEKETDLISIETSGVHTGIYFILGGHLTLESSLIKKHMKNGPQLAKARLGALKRLIEVKLDGQADEIIIAFSPTTEGDLTSLYLKKELTPFAKRITRLGRGIPTGGDIEFADEQTLEEALKNRS